MKLDSQQKQSLLDFISENWEQFIAHVEGREMVERDRAEEMAEEISDALTQEVMYG